MTQQSESTSRRYRIGSGIITGIADDDPSGIATYTQGGAEFGFKLSWTLLLTFPLMAAIQIASARIGRITGKGLVDNFQRQFPRWAVAVLVALLAVANVINLGADLRAMGDVTALASGMGSTVFWVILYGLGSLVLIVFVPYRQYVKVLQALTLSILAYVGVALAVKLNWLAALRELITPHWISGPDYLTTVVAILGTSISPCLFFWQASQEVEEIERIPDRQPISQAPRQAIHGLRQIRVDTWIGMGVSNLIAFFMLVAAAATLHSHGIHQVESTVQAALALEPIAGRFAFALFAMGIVGTGLLATPVLVSTVGYGCASLMHRPQGLHYKLAEAPCFYGALAATMAAGVILGVMPVSSMRALYWSAVINAVMAVPIMAAVVLMASDASKMRGFVLSKKLQFLAWFATGAMGLASLAMFATMARGNP